MKEKNSLDTAERQATALRLRGSGMTYDAIGAEMNCSVATAWRLVRGGLDRSVREPARELISIECERLDRLHEACWERAIGVRTDAAGNTVSVAPDLHAIDRILAISARRSKLLGLDAAKKVSMSGSVIMAGAAEQIAAEYGLDAKEIVAQAERLLKGLGHE